MRYRTSFTKKEVFVVLSCVVFLLASLGAVGSSGRRRAKEAVCLSNLKKWGIVWKSFVDDNDGYLVESLNWLDPLRPYYKNSKLLLCPEAAKQVAPLEQGTNQRGGTFNAWVCWGGSSDSLYLGSYGLNEWCTLSTGGGRTWNRLWKTAYVGGAARAPLLVDSALISLTPLAVDQPPAYDGQIYYPPPMNINEMRGFCLNRHSAAVNGLFLDFSARKVALKELWMLWWHRDWPIPSAMAPPAEFYEPTHWMYNFKNYAE